MLGKICNFGAFRAFKFNPKSLIMLVNCTSDFSCACHSCGLYTSLVVLFRKCSVWLWMDLWGRKQPRLMWREVINFPSSYSIDNWSAFKIDGLLIYPLAVPSLRIIIKCYRKASSALGKLSFQIQACVAFPPLTPPFQTLQLGGKEVKNN